MTAHESQHVSSLHESIKSLTRQLSDKTEELEAQKTNMRIRLVAIHQAIDSALGDSDPDDEYTDDELREYEPLVWAAHHIAALIGPGPWDRYKALGGGS